ncbi:Takeout 1 [Gryllus bimaculatus]|nr:Takeout 1 [Gryllus bimaculatus]
MHCRNIVMKGLANADLVSLRIEKSFFVNVIRIPRLELSGDYSVDGRVLLLPIKGSGKAVFVYENAVVFYKQNHVLEKERDRYYLRFGENSATFNCSNAHFTLENLFNGDKQLGTTLNNFLNENWRAVVDDLGQPFVEAAAQVIREFAFAIIGNVPYDEIFDDVELPE